MRRDLKSFPALLADGLGQQAERNDEVRRQFKKLKQLTFKTVRTDHFGMQMAVSLLLRHVRASSPQRLLAMLMAAYVVTLAVSEPRFRNRHRAMWQPRVLNLRRGLAYGLFVLFSATCPNALCVAEPIRS